ncbi:hypothetical protein ATANTOWER_025408 [Ataeniobius toweri]|uniref:Uncharacterized protein n=1 Tax=Ataeniobius toweri TaxID=208326 RepID=A0ABU7BEQ9_9TELE|nr:hypothetical protein [Ataeniobius toweri]
MKENCSTPPPLPGVPDLHLIVDALEEYLGAKPPVLRRQSVLPMCTCEVWAYPLIWNRVLTWISYLLFDLGSPSFLAVWFGSLKPLDSRIPNLHCNLCELYLPGTQEAKKPLCPPVVD